MHLHHNSRIFYCRILPFEPLNGFPHEIGLHIIRFFLRKVPLFDFPPHFRASGKPKEFLLLVVLNHTRGKSKAKLVHGISQVDLAVVWFDSDDTSVSDRAPVSPILNLKSITTWWVTAAYLFSRMDRRILSGIPNLLVILLTTVSKSSSLIPVITLQSTPSLNSSNVNPLTGVPPP